MSNVLVVSSPLVQNSLGILRDKNTEVSEFRKHTEIVAKMLLSAALSDLKLSEKQIETPIGPHNATIISDSIVAVPILRAGLSLLSSTLLLLPQVKVGFIGLVRDEQTAIADKYYEKLPEIHEEDTVLILDPMLATGGSLDEAINIIKKAGAKRIKAVTVLCAPEGIQRVTSSHPDIEIITAVIDEKLNDKAYIVPGLGDFGDRYFGTT